MGETRSDGRRSALGPVLLRRAGQLLLTVLAQAAILFAAAGRLNWWQGWLYIGLFLGTIAVNAVILLRGSPQTIASRASAAGAKPWDKVIGALIGVVYMGGLLAVAGLDARFGWTMGTMPPALTAAAVGLYALGSAVVAWAMVSNKFFSGVVRIQKEEGHVVVTGGPYRYVRHPGYAAAAFTMTATVLILGSTWTLIAGGLLLVLLVVRTAFEDRMLHEELTGYRDYAQRVRFRLVPGVW